MEIQDYPNYLIYPDGRIWSIPRKGATAGRFMKTPPNSEGYLMTMLRYQGQGKTHRVHRVVAEHYIPNPENKPTVDHIDRNPANNHVSNLRWATIPEQMANKGAYANNTSGHTNITDVYSNQGRNLYWKFHKKRKGHKTINKQFKSKVNAICYKYIALLKIKAGVI